MDSKAMRGLVTSVTRVSSTLSKIQVRLSHGLKYFPGQSIWISPLSERLMGGGLTGFYQLCGCPEKALRSNQYEFLAETNPVLNLIRGLGKVKPGDFLKVEGPFGSFWPLSARPDDFIIWIASPEKLGPFLACVQSKNFQRIRPQRIILLVEATSEETVPFLDEFESRGVVVRRFNWDRVEMDIKRARFFISAEKPLLREVWSTLVHEKGVSAEQIIHHGVGMAPCSYGEALREKIIDHLKAA